jgi:asparagine synthase (glutamine-hydrolysing)
VQTIHSPELHGAGKAACLKCSMTFWRMVRCDGVKSELGIGERTEGGSFEAHNSVELVEHVLDAGPEAHQEYVGLGARIAAEKAGSRDAERARFNWPRQEQLTMSGFVGILNLNEVPVDRARLERMTQSLAFRGPDAQGVWCEGPVGLGHALLQITRGASIETQPAQLHGCLWIVADARIDGRAELIDKLKSTSRSADSLSLSSTDADLILHAYDAWGETCVQHLRGDFSFAIWNAPTKRLFCARDHFGVKPFFYARMGSCLIFSNTLDCVRTHPAVSSRLSDLAIADFLLFDMNQDSSTTSFADIQRLPPAHMMTCDHERLSQRRYWALSVTTFVHYARDSEYVEHFRQLFDTAVADRLRTESAGVLMSGGLDSTLVAASARRFLSGNGTSPGLRAYTDVFKKLIPHEERHYATLVAEALKIPIEYILRDDDKIFERADQPELQSPEPRHTVWPNFVPDQLRRIVTSSRVGLTGYGGDPTLCGRISVHFRHLIKKKQFGCVLADAMKYFMAEGRFSRLYLRKRWHITFATSSETPRYPVWLNEDLEKRLGLRERWEAIGNAATSAGSARPEAYQAMVAPMWQNLFEEHDAGNSGVLVDIRHPFFDLRLVNFLLALPRLPWCCDKQLLREAGRGLLPDAVRLRRKSPLLSDPLVARLQLPESAWVDRFEPVPGLENYTARNRIPIVHGEKDPWAAWTNLRPLSLNFWLPRASSIR